MSKKKPIKRKRSKAAQQKKKLMITAGLAVVLVVVIVIAVFLLGGCSAYETDANTIYILKDGKVVSNNVESFDEEVYGKDELKSYIKDVINTYNSENGKLVKQKTLKVKDGVATLVMEYASPEVFEDFEGTEIFVGSLADAVAAGYTFEGDFANVADGSVKPCTAEDFLNGDYKVIIVKANVNVSLEEGEICIVSATNTESVKDGVVVIREGANILATGEIEATETTEGTEVDETISGDEVFEEEEEEIIFDFGDEEAAENKYSSVYTYIIYK